MTAKDAAPWVGILVAFGGAVSAHVRAATLAEVQKEQLAKVEASVESVRTEGRSTRDMAIETRGQVAQILAGLSRLEQTLQQRTVVVRARGNRAGEE